MADEKENSADQPNNPGNGNDQPQESAKSLVRKTLELVPELKKGVEDNSRDIEAIKARSDALKSEKALTFSFFVWLYTYTAHLYFFAIGHPLVLPEYMNQITWALIVGPWLGHGLGRFVNTMTDRFGTEKAK